MKNYIYYISLISSIFLFSCYSDKGSNDYIDIYNFDVKFSSTNIVAILGEEVSCTPDIIWENKKDAEDAKFLTYKWEIHDNTDEGKVIFADPDWVNPTFSWVSDSVFVGIIRLVITDTRTDIKRNQPDIHISVNTKYSLYYGFSVLSEKNGESIYSIIMPLSDKEKEELEEDRGSEIASHEEALKIIPNLFAEVNAGASLGRGPISMREHWWRDKKSPGATLIMQESGAVDVEGKNYTLYSELSKAFVGGKIPPGVEFVESSFMGFVDVLQDSKGRLYSRIRMSDELPHITNFFSPEPLKFEGEVLENCEILKVPIFSISSTKMTLILDRKEGRLLMLIDGNMSSSESDFLHAGKIVEAPSLPASATGLVPLDDLYLDGNEILDIAFTRTSNSGSGNIKIHLFMKKENKFYIQTFMIKRNSRTIDYLIYESASDKAVIYEVKGLTQDPDAVWFHTYKGTSDMFFAIGKDLYRFDRANADKRPIALHKSFESEITHIESDMYTNFVTAVCLKNGDIYILNTYTPTANIDDEVKVAWELLGNDIGRIVDIKAIQGLYGIYRY